MEDVLEKTQILLEEFSTIRSSNEDSNRSVFSNSVIPNPKRSRIEVDESNQLDIWVSVLPNNIAMRQLEGKVLVGCSELTDIH